MTTRFTYRGYLIEISDEPNELGFEFTVKIDGQDRTASVMTWPADPDPEEVSFGLDAGPVKRAKLFSIGRMAVKDRSLSLFGHRIELRLR